MYGTARKRVYRFYNVGIRIVIGERSENHDIIFYTLRLSGSVGIESPVIIVLSRSVATIVVTVIII